ELGKRKKEGQVLVGFALETGDGSQEAERKLEDKNADLIVLNSLKDNGAGFRCDTNTVTLYGTSNDPEEIPLDLKSGIARKLFDRIPMTSS
ncbi:MAG: phosphopantothenoylcysteine decarboxylase, partial [Flavobacteriales bacterium]